MVNSSLPFNLNPRHLPTYSGEVMGISTHLYNYAFDLERLAAMVALYIGTTSGIRPITQGEVPQDSR
jgi:hypothetical protein